MLNIGEGDSYNHLCSTRKFFKLLMKLSFDKSNFPISNGSDDVRSSEGGLPRVCIFIWFLRSPGVENDLGHSSQGCGFSLTWVIL